MSVRNTEPGRSDDKQQDRIHESSQRHDKFYGVTGMKREIIYTNNKQQGGKVHDRIADDEYRIRNFDKLMAFSLTDNLFTKQDI